VVLEKISKISKGIIILGRNYGQKSNRGEENNQEESRKGSKGCCHHAFGRALHP
jgi:hypothetical protein